MGCGTSRHKKEELNAHEELLKLETGGTKTQRVLNAWDNTAPIPAPYPQGKVDLNKMLRSESIEQGTVYDPNPEIVQYVVEGDLVPAREFYAIQPVQPISQQHNEFSNNLAFERNEPPMPVTENQNRVMDNRQRDMAYA